ncbi:MULTISPECIES: SLAP domain-containing protein [unclassified Lactobacillus]|uniref:SLAP domain-containing protein n=1 Tax=unclassified Lactobacillus TaxID=2620435 RepID=UPI00226A66BC|nr:MULTISPECIES: SLAP domain-containing protein [unclassified Lactobacillus]MCX8721355.1 SLAP domain-containing protein [Lactobacillus sp. B4010]MCX8733459.1 SLAP domain-containing protein [Lactobacillus sp. B4015]MCX8735679.1 SLAP domain-containing protein [Lactobacillus sp. B4012]
MDKKIAKRIAIALCGVALTGVGTTSIIKENTYTASANNAYGTKVWIQYGTLKYDLRGPSGHIYRAGTKVVRDTYSLSQPPKSLPSHVFYLTSVIGGTPGLQGIQDAAGGKISETYVNVGDWNLQDYPSDSVTLVNNAINDTDLSSSDFHPVDNSNPDVTHADVSAFKKAMAEYRSVVDFNHLTNKERELVALIGKQEDKAYSIGASQEYVDQATAYVNQVTANYKKTGHLTDSGAVDKPTSPSTNPTTPTTGSGSSTTTPSPTIPTSKSHYVKLRKASYRYTHKGKRVSKKLLKKGSVVKINGKVYRIKGKTFYRIAKNRYIRVVNVAK